MKWTHQEIRTLTDLWPTALTTTEIGDRLGKSKGSICSQVRRLELPFRREPEDTIPPPKPNIFRVVAGNVTFKTCQWLDGEPAGRDFCGDQAQPNSPYCPEHHKRCYIPEKKKVAA